MCRMFGLAATHPVSAADLLRDAPRSLRELSREHADGWGIALHRAGRWSVERDTQPAATSARFDAVAATDASVVIAHVRKKTVGPTAIANTHPFTRDQLVFAHNGTVANLAAITARTAPEHAAAVAGDTDSERLFAFVLTHIDEAGDVARGVAAAVRALHAIADIGSINFLLSCGHRLYAHRLGRSLFVAHRRDMAIVASEPATADETWRELADGALVILDPPAAPALAA